MLSKRIIKDRTVRDSLIGDLIEDWTWEFDFNNNQIYISPNLLKFLGYELEESSDGKRFFISIIHPNDIQFMRESVQECRLRRIDIFSVRFRVKTKRGRYKWVFCKAKVQYDEKENPLLMMGYYLTLDNFKEIKENNRRFHTLFDNISDAVFIISADEKNPGTIIEVNNNAVKLTGFTKKELIKKHIYDLSPKHLEDKEVDIRNEILEKGTYYFNAFIISKDNRTIPVEVNSTQVELDNEIVHVSVVRDISERIRAEEALRESEERSRKIVQMSPTGAIIYEDDIITYINDTAARLLGASSSGNIIGKPVPSIIHKDYWEISARRRASLKYGVIPEHMEMKFVRCDGGVIFAELSTIPIMVSGKIAGLSYIEDITEQKRIFEEKQKLLEHTLEYDRIKTEFFSNISHELRTPLNIILSSIQLLNSVYNNKPIQPEKFFNTYESYIGSMKQNSYRLLKLISNLIDITRIDTGFIKTELRNENIVETVENICMSAIPYLEAKGISLVFDTDIEEKVIAFDENQIERILLNLLSNAVKFTSSGGKIDVIIKDREKSIDIIIKDTGCGIPEDKLHVIFDRFRQVDSLLTRKAEGSGIGLSLVKSLVEAHGGSINANSIVGKGSEFIINLPSKTVDESTETYTHQHEIRDRESKVELINIEFSDIYN